MRLEDLDTFMQVAELGSFTAVAQAWGVPKSTISRRVARLERELGKTLVSRESDGSRLTPAGHEARARGARVQAEVASLQGAGPPPPSVLRVVVAPEVATSPGFSRLLTEYRAARPEVVCEVVCTARRVDMQQERVDVVFRLHLSPLRGGASLKARTLGRLRGEVYAAPEWAAANPIEHPGALAEVEVLTLAGGTLRHHWTLEHAEQGSLQIAVRPGLLGSQLPWLASMAAAGHGPSVLPPHVAAPYVQAGRLVRILEGWSTPSVRLSLVWAGSGPEPEPLRDFIDRVPSLDGLLAG